MRSRFTLQTRLDYYTDDLTKIVKEVRINRLSYQPEAEEQLRAAQELPTIHLLTIMHNNEQMDRSTAKSLLMHWNF